MKLRSFSAAAVLTLARPLLAAPVLAPPAQQLGPDIQPYVSVQPGRIAIQHIRIIDGTSPLAYTRCFCASCSHPTGSNQPTITVVPGSVA